ncbi:hypothetical protein JCM11251_005666 [Rhodosporidiobolus azoricus]
MFDLPPELVDDILEFAAPAASTLNEAKPREDTLSACCLVSRTFRERAQPILWRDVVFRQPNGPARFLEVVKEGGVGDLRRTVRSIRWLNKSAPRYDRIEEVVRLSSGLKELELVFSSTPVAVEQFGEKTLTALTSLSLWNVSLLPVPASFPTFPHLTTLEFEGVYVPPETLDKLLTSSTLPSLCALSLGQFDYGGRAVFPQLDPAFLAQLKDFQLTFSAGLTPPFPPEILDSSSPVALIIEINDLEDLEEHVAANPNSVLPPHLFFDSFYAPRETICTPYSRLAALLLASPTPIQSIHLPVSLLLTPDHNQELEILLVQCEEQEVEVVWRQEEQAFLMGLSESFRRYARAVK